MKMEPLVTQPEGFHGFPIRDLSTDLNVLEYVLAFWESVNKMLSDFNSAIGWLQGFGFARETAAAPDEKLIVVGLLQRASTSHGPLS